MGWRLKQGRIYFNRETNVRKLPQNRTPVLECRTVTTPGGASRLVHFRACHYSTNVDYLFLRLTRLGKTKLKWRSHGRLSVGRGRGEIGGKGTGNKKYNWQVQNRQGEAKNSIGNGKAKEFICMTHGHELRGDCWRE